MKINKLMIAAAGSGKTTFLVNEALSQNDKKVLITTFTEANRAQIRHIILQNKGYIPPNITIQTWFSFLLQHGVRPYQSALDNSIDDKDIGFILINGKSGRRNSEGEYISDWPESNVQKHYFTEDMKIYSDKISKFVCRCNEKTNNEVINRISRIFSYIFVDEIQDLVGYDLEIIKLLLKSNSSVLLVGDPRQVTYSTHSPEKHKKYTQGRVKEFIQNELEKPISCEIDEETLNRSHRNNQMICDFSARLFPSLPKPLACCCDACRNDSTDHEGIFLVKKTDIEKYLLLFNPMQLRWDSKTKCNPQFPVLNLGESKGCSFNRVLIYPTANMVNWIKNNRCELTEQARAKFYVGITRARFSVAIIMDYKDNDLIEGVKKFS